MTDEQKTQQEIEDEEFGQKLQRWFTRHIVSLVGCLGYLALILGFLFFWQARSEHANLTNDIETVREQIKQNQLILSGQTDYNNLLYKFYTEEKARAEAENDREEQKRLQRLIERLDKISDKMTGAK